MTYDTHLYYGTAFSWRWSHDNCRLGLVLKHVWMGKQMEMVLFCIDCWCLSSKNVGNIDLCTNDKEYLPIPMSLFQRTDFSTG